MATSGDYFMATDTELIWPRMLIPKIIRGYLHYLRLSAS